MIIPTMAGAEVQLSISISDKHKPARRSMPLVDEPYLTRYQAFSRLLNCAIQQIESMYRNQVDNNLLTVEEKCSITNELNDLCKPDFVFSISSYVHFAGRNRDTYPSDSTRLRAFYN